MSYPTLPNNKFFTPSKKYPVKLLATQDHFKAGDSLHQPGDKAWVMASPNGAVHLGVGLSTILKIAPVEGIDYVHITTTLPY